MPETTTSLVKDSDYEITQHRVTTSTIIRKNSGYSSHEPMMREQSIARTFNFLSGKITTIVSDAIYQGADTKEYAAAAGVGVSTFTEFFAEQATQLEIEKMHAELKKQGGKPPSLEEIRNGYAPTQVFFHKR